MRVHVAGGRLVDPANGVDAPKDLYIAQGRVVAVGRAPAGFEAKLTIDARGQIVCPGFVDIGARLREPGAEHVATIASETRAAARGGVTTLCCPPDTSPVIDTPAVAELVHQRAEAAGFARVVCLGALTRGLAGETLAEMHALKRIGCVGVSNAQQPIADTEVLRRALEYAASCDLPAFLYPEDPWLGRGGHMHEGAVSTRLGIPAVPETVETIGLSRDLLLIEQTGARVHFCRLSTARGVRMIQEARRRGLPVTADVGIYHLHMTDEDTRDFDGLYHVRPPFRSSRDRTALRQALARGALDAIASDHQPHDHDAKNAPFTQTLPGISALETLLPLALRLVRSKLLDLGAVVAALSSRPAAILRLDAGHLAPGAPADVCVFDPEKPWSPAVDGRWSAGRNTPLADETLLGRVSHTLFGGRVVFRSR
jgi:dihydroorotase